VKHWPLIIVVWECRRPTLRGLLKEHSKKQEQDIYLDKGQTPAEMYMSFLNALESRFTGEEVGNDHSFDIVSQSQE